MGVIQRARPTSALSIVVVLALWIGGAQCASVQDAENVIVAMNGTDESGCGTSSSPCGTIGYAAGVANGSQSVQVQAGEYESDQCGVLLRDVDTVIVGMGASIDCGGLVFMQCLSCCISLSGVSFSNASGVILSGECISHSNATINNINIRDSTSIGPMISVTRSDLFMSNVAFDGIELRNTLLLGSVGGLITVMGSSVAVVEQVKVTSSSFDVTKDTAGAAFMFNSVTELEVSSMSLFNVSVATASLSGVVGIQSCGTIRVSKLTMDTVVVQSTPAVQGLLYVLSFGMLTLSDVATVRCIVASSGAAITGAGASLVNGGSVLVDNFLYADNNVEGLDIIGMSLYVREVNSTTVSNTTIVRNTASGTGVKGAIYSSSSAAVTVQHGLWSYNDFSYSGTLYGALCYLHADSCSIANVEGEANVASGGIAVNGGLISLGPGNDATMTNCTLNNSTVSASFSINGGLAVVESTNAHVTGLHTNDNMIDAAGSTLYGGTLYCRSASMCAVSNLSALGATVLAHEISGAICGWKSVKTATLSDARVSGCNVTSTDILHGMLYASDATDVTVTGLVLAENVANCGTQLLGSAIYTHTDTVSISDSAFVANNASAIDILGGVVYMYGTGLRQAALEHCMFSDNYLEASPLRVQGCVFMSGELSAVLNISSCAFTGNVARTKDTIVGGTAVTVASGTIGVRDSHFVNNSAISHQGGVLGVSINAQNARTLELYNSTFEANSAVSGNFAVQGQGRAISFVGGDVAINNVESLRIANCTFRECRTVVAGEVVGGCLSYISGSDCSITDTLFAEATAVGLEADLSASNGGSVVGAAVYIMEMEAVYFTGVTVEHCVGAGIGLGQGGSAMGVVVVLDSSQVVIDNSTFRYNRVAAASAIGGALLTYNNTNTTIERSVLHNNSVNARMLGIGGSVAMFSLALENQTFSTMIRESLFEENEALSERFVTAGALFVGGSGTRNAVAVMRTKFMRNSAKAYQGVSGGAITVNNCEFSMSEQCVVASNRAVAPTLSLTSSFTGSVTGGAIQAGGNNNPVIRINDTAFENNVVEIENVSVGSRMGAGGSVIMFRTNDLLGASLYISSVSVENNTVIGSDIIFGGCFYVRNVVNVGIENVTIANCASLTGSQGQCSGSALSFDGASPSHYLLRDVTITNATATVRPGIATENLVETFGTAIWLVGFVNTSMERVHVSKCRSPAFSAYGTVAVVAGVQFFAVNSSITGCNCAAMDTCIGAALLVELVASSKLDSCAMTNNVAFSNQSCSGVVTLSRCGSFSMISSNVSDNTLISRYGVDKLQAGAGMLANVVDSLSLSECTMERNAIQGLGDIRGGAVSLNQVDSFSFDACHFEDNSLGPFDPSAKGQFSLQGAAMSVYYCGAGEIVHSSFANNSITGGEISNQITVLSLGGAVSAQVTNEIAIRDCLFDANAIVAPFSLTGGGVPAQGGAIGTRQCGNVTVDGCRFLRNTVVGGDSATSGPGEAMGGAVALLHGLSQSVVANCTFDNNRATSGRGIGGVTVRAGALCVVTTTSVYVHNCSATDNSANVVGTHATLGGSAVYGGAFAITAASAIVSASNVSGNRAYLERGGTCAGGGLYVAVTADLTLTSTDFADNIAHAKSLYDSGGDLFGRTSSSTASGGGLHASTIVAGARLSISDSTYTRNEASVSQSVIVQSLIDTCGETFRALGGGIALSATADNSCVFSAVTLLSNKALSEFSAGGGAYVSGCALQYSIGNVSRNSASHFTSRMPTNRTLDSHFGDMRWNDPDGVQSTVVARNATAAMCGECPTHCPPSALFTAYGGGLVIQGDSPVADSASGDAVAGISMQESSSTARPHRHNSTSGIAITNVVFSENYAQSGGALCLMDVQKRVVVTGSNFTDNDASFAGGAIYVTRTIWLALQLNMSRPELVNVSFVNNNAICYGADTASDPVSIRSVLRPTSNIWSGLHMQFQCQLIDVYNRTATVPGLQLRLTPIQRESAPEVEWWSSAPNVLLQTPDPLSGFYWFRPLVPLFVPQDNVFECATSSDQRECTTVVEIAAERGLQSTLAGEVLTYSFLTLPCPPGYHAPASGTSSHPALGILSQACIACADGTYNIDGSPTCNPCPTSDAAVSAVPAIWSSSTFDNSGSGNTPAGCIRAMGPLEAVGRQQFHKHVRVPEEDDSDLGAGLPDNGRYADPLRYGTQIVSGTYMMEYDDDTYLLPCQGSQACSTKNCTVEVSDSGWQLSCNACPCLVSADGTNADSQDSSTCPGDNLSASECFCADGYESRLCSRCVRSDDECYFSVASGSRCISEHDAPPAWFMTLYVLVAMAMLIVWFVGPHTGSSSGLKKSFTFYLQALQALGATEFMAAGSGLFGFVTLIVGGGTSYSPGSSHSREFGSSWTWLDWFVTAAPSVQCWIPLHHPVYSLLADCLTPLLFTIPFLVVVLTIYYGMKYAWPAVSLPSDMDVGDAIWSDDREPVHHRSVQVDDADDILDSVESGRKPSLKRQFAVHCANVCIYVMFSAYFNTTAYVLDVFHCVQDELPDGTKMGSYYMNSKPWLECSTSTEWGAMVIVASVVGAFLVIMALAIACALYYQRQRIRARDPAVASVIGFLYENYKPELFWFELAWLVRRILLSAVVTFLTQDWFVQSFAISVVVLLPSIMVHARVNPFRIDSENFLDLCSIIAILLSYYSAVVFSQQCTAAGSHCGTMDTVVTVIILGLAVLVAGVYVVLIVRNWIRSHGTTVRRYLRRILSCCSCQ